MLTSTLVRSKVQVTLQIVKALMEKSPRDLPLYAHAVLQILITVLRSKDLTLVEDSIPTFEAFCTHHDIATLAADQEHNRQYEELVRTYASFASQSPPVQTKVPVSTPVAMRWRSVGLQAIKCVASSEALGSDGGGQLTLIMPVILQNLYSDNGDRLLVLQQRAQSSETTDREQAVRRRMSIATVRTLEEHDTHPVALSATADDADKLAEEEVGLLALQSLRQIFIVNNRTQIRIATATFLKFISSKISSRTFRMGRGSRSSSTGGWATTLMEMTARWTPVQDRFVVLVTIMETLVRSPVIEDNVEQQLVLATLVSWLLSSSINLIGLSVMDVLLGLVQHILLVLQLGGKGSNVLPHHQQTDAIELFQDAKENFDQFSSTDDIEKTAITEDAILPSVTRQQLLVRLQKCIGDLATHIYYSDQISDMIAAILLRLKPSPMSGISTAAAAIEHPAAAAQAISRSVNLQEDPNTDDFFSFDTVRVTALKAIKDVLTVANLRGPAAGIAAMGRNKVSAQVWEGTQWLLRDVDQGVRRAYVDALLTWLKLEMSKSDLRVMEDRRKMSKSSAKREAGDVPHPDLAKRAVSNASQREKVPKPPKSTFLQLLHLAIYDDAIESPESESEVLVLHLLLINLVEKLGVNAAKSGLPMVVRLQEDINNDDVIATPLAKVNIGSLVHGYFWALSEKLDFDTSRVGYEIHSEITRRKRKGLWVDKIRLPPLPLDQIRRRESLPMIETTPLPRFERESLKPFDGRAAMVDQIAAAYAASLASPPPSAPSSPGRVFSIPVFGSGRTLLPSSASEDQLPPEIKEAMLADWTKEACIARVEKESAKTASVNGSKSGTTPSGARNFLTVNGNPTNGNSRTQSPQSHHHHRHHENSRPPSAAYGLVGGLSGLQKLRRSSAQEGSPTPISSSDRSSTVRVDELKRVLAGNPRNASPLRLRQHSVSSSESMASGEFSASEISYTHAAENIASADFAHENPRTTPQEKQVAGTAADRPTPLAPLDEAEVNAAALAGEKPYLDQLKDDEDVPPVPPLPPSFSLPGDFPMDTAQASSSSPTMSEAQRPSTAPGQYATQDGTQFATGASRSLRHGKSSPGSRRDDNVATGVGRVDLGKLLGGIEVTSGREEGMGIGRPPY